MRALIIWILSCMSVFAADESVRMTTKSSRDSDTGIIHVEDTFTRDGQINLIRTTSIKDGTVSGRVQRFYHEGELVAAYVFVISPAHMARETFTTAESSYSV